MLPNAIFPLKGAVLKNILGRICLGPPQRSPQSQESFSSIAICPIVANHPGPTRAGQSSRGADVGQHAKVATYVASHR